MSLQFTRGAGLKPDGAVTPKLMAQIMAAPKPRSAPARSARSRMAAPKRATKTPARAAVAPTARSRMGQARLSRGGT